MYMYMKTGQQNNVWIRSVLAKWIFKNMLYIYHDKIPCQRSGVEHRTKE